MVETTQSGIRQRATDDAADTDQPAAGAGFTPRTRGGTPVKALCWEGVNEVAVEEVPDPQIINKQDAIAKLKLSSVCGSDLHQISGYIPEMRSDAFSISAAATRTGLSPHQSRRGHDRERLFDQVGIEVTGRGPMRSTRARLRNTRVDDRSRLISPESQVSGAI
jgi:Alcohol dehydrogenase GroES-associated